MEFVKDEPTRQQLDLVMLMQGLDRPVMLPPGVPGERVRRLYVHQAKFEAGLVLFPEGASFLPELETELLSFPQAKHDDQVDSITQALSHKPGGYDSSLLWVTGK